MVIVKVMGGLGNQFFTYALAYSLAKEQESAVVLDKIIYHTSYALRRCQLECFSIKPTKVLIPFSFGHSKLSKKIYVSYHDILLKLRYNPRIIAEKEEFNFQNIDVGKDNIYLKGYWQNYRYFNNCRQDFVDQFQLRNPTDKSKKFADKAIHTKPIAVHVRRGDYKTFKGGKCLSKEYYLQALDYLQKQFGIKSSIWVFTDDVEYCKTIFNGFDDIYYVAEMGEMTDVEEFWIMSKCAYFIIANSSFSWWAAYLSEASEKKVVAPIVDMWKQDFYLPEWITIEADIEGTEQ